jgi:hypothetical protein
MKGSFLGPRLSRRDIQELNRASNSLAAAAEVIQRANPAWAAGAINAIIVANDIVVRILDKGGRAVERFTARIGAQAGQEDSSEGGPDDMPNPDQNVEPGKA